MGNQLLHGLDLGKEGVFTQGLLGKLLENWLKMGI